MLLAFALAALAAHLTAITQYGYFRDELYYLACTHHLAWGYVDQPPLSIAILWVVRHLLGDSLLAIRIVPALAGAAVVYLTGRLARTLGGGRAAQALAALAALLAPAFLGLCHTFSMNPFDLLLWALAFTLLLPAVERGAASDWLLLGAALGLGLLNKISVLWLGGGVAAGLLFTERRALLRTRGPWLAAAVALALFLPHIGWQIAHGWPTLEFMRNATAQKMAPVTLASFATSQLLVMGPGTAPFWLTGLALCFLVPAGKRGRMFGIAYVAIFAFLVVAGRSRATYLAPAYMPLFALGGLAVEQAARRPRLRWFPPAAGAWIAALALPLAPLALPILPVERFAAYSKALGAAPRSEERKSLGELPQHYADMFGWEEMAREVAAVYRALPPEDRARCGIFAENYGEAGAIDLFGPGLGLPPVMSGHNSYWLWGPGRADGSVVILLGGSLEAHRTNFERVEQVGLVRCDHCMPYERDLPVFVGHGPRTSLAKLWPRLKVYD
jgi:4-amino-4-deoxy-L-arabinose transferase-like glycosyltransferase